MAATMVVSVCEDHEDYRLPNWWDFPQQKIRKREHDFLAPNKTYLNKLSTHLKHVQSLFHTHTGSTCAGSYDVLWCFTSMSYHCHAENVLSVKGRHCVWAIVSCYIPTVMGHPKDTSGWIVAGVCEDHQDYKLMEPSTAENPKKGEPFSYAKS